MKAPVNLDAGTLGVLETHELQNEYLLVCAAFDCVRSGRWEWIADVRTWFKDEYISDPYMQSLFHAILDIQEHGEPLEEAVLLAKVPADGQLHGKRLADLYSIRCDSCSQVGNLRFYAQQVYREYRREHASKDASDAAKDILCDPDPDRVIGTLPEISSRYLPPEAMRGTKNKTAMQEVLDGLEGKRDESSYHFGLRGVDETVDGVPRGSLVTIGARSSNGKSVFLAQCAMRSANIYKRPVLFFTVEMSQEELYRRWASHLSRQPFRGGDRSRIIDGLSRIRVLETDGLLHVFSGAHTVEQVMAQAKSFARDGKLGMICVDYIQAITPTRSRSEGREQQVAHIARSLKELAMDTGVPVLTASQLNKDGEDDPRGSTMRESEAIYNYSNIVLLLQPDQGADKFANTVKMKIIIDKNRDGAKGVAFTQWERPLFTLRDEEAVDLQNYDGSLEDWS